MSFRNVQGNNVPARTLGAVRRAEQWVRNPAWPALTAPTIGEQKLVGLHAVWPGDGVGNGGNFFAVNCAAAYTVAFGDGTSVNTATGVQTNYEYNFADVDLYDATVTLTDAGDLVERTAHGYSNGMRVQFYSIVTTTGLVEAQFYFVINATANDFQVAATEGGAALALTTNGSASLLPYKIATVTITPQAGQNLTTVNLFVKNTTTGLQAYSTGWLELAIAGSNITTLTVSSAIAIISQNYLESVNIVELGAVTTFFNLFVNCRKLQNVSVNVPTAATDINSMFQSCSSLTTVQLFNTAAVTNMSSMFLTCSSLVTVPLFNTAAVTNINSMFRNCSSLTTVPLFNTAAVTSFGRTFSGCSSLTTVPALVTTAVTSSAGFSTTFTSCNSLARIQAEDFRFTFSVASCKLSAAALNEIYTNLPVAVSQTITVSNNYGTTGDNPAIATAKGWTVTG